jgi:hypothetical protein
MTFRKTAAAFLAVMVSSGVTGAQDRADKPTDAAKNSVRSQFFNWTKVRLDEIEATLTTWEVDIAKLPGEARAKAESALAIMRAKRDAFRQTIQKETEQIATDFSGEKAAREADWKVFEAGAQKFIDDARTELQQQKAAFLARADAQHKAWQTAIDKLQQDVAKTTAEKKTKADAAVRQMKADAAAARAKLEKLKEATASSWAAYEKALEETRVALDRAGQTAHDAFTK